MYKMEGHMNCNMVLERTDKYGKSVVNKMENLPDGLYFIEKKNERFGVCAISGGQSDAVALKPIKEEAKPNKAISVTKKTIKKKLFKKAGK